jgi:hypothetical protein
MQKINLGNPGEQKKLIWAVVLGLAAIVFLWWTFFGFGGSSNPTPNNRGAALLNASPVARPVSNQGRSQTVLQVKGDLLNQLRPILFHPMTLSVPEAKRNIFAYYEELKPVAAVPVAPSPTPTATPPVLLAAVSPSNVYARTGDFTLEATGDKFTAEMRLTMDGHELSTVYTSPQQLSASVPAAMIANPGGRQIVVRSPDGKLYSNPAVINVTPPPTPNYSYVGIIGTSRHLDTAILQDKGSKEILNVQRGDVLGGRFRVTSIADKELVLMDTNLKIKHTLPFSEGERGANPLQRPTPKVQGDDDEP